MQTFEGQGFSVAGIFIFHSEECPGFMIFFNIFIDICLRNVHGLPYLLYGLEARNHLIFMGCDHE